MTFRPVVVQQTAGQEFRWKGGLFVPRLFEGEHYFRLAPTAASSTLFTHGERFSGLLVPLLRRTLEVSTKAGFEAMNHALKQRVENG